MNSWLFFYILELLHLNKYNDKIEKKGEKYESKTRIQKNSK